ncbi:MAG: GNAT family N-acetyltransferase [Clostridia bacterium]|nr:GNAT family N-acetyltransferase [Clostridia bacterium]
MVKYILAKPGDEFALSALRKQVWATTYRGIYPDEYIDGYDFLEHMRRDARRLASGESRVYFIRAACADAGYFGFGKPDRPFADYAFCLNSLYLLPEYRGRGIGRDVFEFVKAELRDLNADVFFNACNVHNAPAIGFYTRMGGKLVGVSDGHINKAEDQCYFEHRL